MGLTSAAARPGWVRKLRDFARRLDVRRLSPAQLERHLKRLGVVPGAVVMLHSSMNIIARRVPSLTAKQLIDLILEMVTPAGTLMMPAYPFLGRQEDYVKQGRAFDVRRTPSRVGLLTEVFRRRTGVIRSLHPTHSVCAYGRLASELTRDHHLGAAFGPTSPFCKMSDHDGLALGLGCGPGVFVPFHVPEYLHPLTRSYHYSESSYTMTVVDGDVSRECEVVTLRADRQRAPYYRALAELLTKEGLVRFSVRGGLPMGSVPVGPFIQRAMPLIEEGRYSIPRGEGGTPI